MSRRAFARVAGADEEARGGDRVETRARGEGADRRGSEREDRRAGLGGGSRA